MIHSIADLLQEFVKVEVDLLNQHPNKHPVTVGSMFEGLTEEALNRTVFEGLDLSVVKNSFIDGLKQEFDVLLVVGKGERIPHTDRYTFEQKQVIAIFQVKKNLFTNDLEEAYDNLSLIPTKFNVDAPPEFVGRMFRDGFQGVTGRALTAQAAGLLTDGEDAIYSILQMDAILPVRIIWGFNGFKREENLRKALMSILQKNQVKGIRKENYKYHPAHFPNLIICGPYSIIKNNGMPFGVPMQDGLWHLLTSSSYNSAYFVLDALWSRLSYQFELPMNIFGEDLQQEPSTRFIDCLIQNKGQRMSLNYQYFGMKEKDLRENKKSVSWEPVELDMEQYVIVDELCRNGVIDLRTDDGIESFVMKGGYNSLQEFLDRLLATRLVTLENQQLKLLTDQCQAAFLPDGRAVAGENKSGRFTRWVDRFMKEFKEKKSTKSN